MFNNVRKRSNAKGIDEGSVDCGVRFVLFSSSTSLNNPPITHKSSFAYRKPTLIGHSLSKKKGNIIIPPRCTSRKRDVGFEGMQAFLFKRGVGMRPFVAFFNGMNIFIVF